MLLKKLKITNLLSVISSHPQERLPCSWGNAILKRLPKSKFYSPPDSKSVLILGIASLLIFLALSAFIFNHLFFQYSGNNYFPRTSLVISGTLFFIWAGGRLQFGSHHFLTQTSKELIYFFLVMTCIALATNAAQYTPFPPIDRHLIRIEETLHIHLAKILHWRSQHLYLTKALSFAYDSLPYQMTFLPIIVIALQKRTWIREYYYFLLATAVIGFSLYYFFPTLGPATFIQSPYFSMDQHATGIKFREIHQHQLLSTYAGGMIAFPSFHAIWAFLCLLLVRKSLPALIILAPLNGLLIASCILLGWHYFLDIIGSIMVLLSAQVVLFLLQWQQRIRFKTFTMLGF